MDTQRAFRTYTHNTHTTHNNNKHTATQHNTTQHNTEHATQKRREEMKAMKEKRRNESSQHHTFSFAARGTCSPITGLNPQTVSSNKVIVIVIVSPTGDEQDARVPKTGEQGKKHNNKESPLTAVVPKLS